MARRYRDPWAKKSKKGMKSLGTMAKVGGVLGYAAYNSIKSTNAQTRHLNQATKTKNISPKGCGIIAIGFILGAIIGICAGSFMAFGIIFLGTAFVVSIMTIVSSDDNTEQTLSSTDTKEKVLINSNPKFKETTDAIKKSIMEKVCYEPINTQLNALPVNLRKECFLQALLSALNEYNLMSEIPNETEKYIDALTAKMNISEDILASKSQYVDFTKSLIVQDILHGITPHRATLTRNPINFQKDEILIWPFVGVVLYEEVVRRQSVGASRGISVRVASGIYYRVGAFKGEPLVTSSLQPKYSGSLIITNKNVYFYSVQKSIRLPYGKILSFVPFEDGIGIQPDRMNAKTIYIKGLDGRFAFNVVSNIQNINN